MMCDWCVTGGSKNPREAQYTVITGTLPGSVDTWFLCSGHADIIAAGAIYHVPGYKKPYQIDEYVIGPLPPGGRR